MSHHKRGKQGHKKDQNWNSPLINIQLKERETINRPKKRKKVCKATKGAHDYQVDEFKITNYKYFSKNGWSFSRKGDVKIYAKYFDLRITFRCPCGKKDWKKEF